MDIYSIIFIYYVILLCLYYAYIIIMVNYSSLTLVERVLMGAIVIVTNAFGIPCVVALFRRRGLEF